MLHSGAHARHMVRLFGSALVLFVAIIAAALFFPPREQTAAPAPAAAPQEPAPPPVGPGQVSLEFDEATINRLAAGSLGGTAIDAGPLGAATVRDLSVKLRSGQIQATGTAVLGPTPLPIALAGTVVAENARPRLSLSDARIGGVQLPQAARLGVEQALQAPVDLLIAGQAIRVSSITIGNGKLTIIGSRA
jgi:hypothetical protein